jgi:streptogramin lyase
VAAVIPVGQFPSEIAMGEGAVWVTVNGADPPERWFVARIDPATNAVTDEIEVNEVVDVAVGGGAVWGLGRDPGIGPAVFRIDPVRREVAATIPLGCGRCFPTQLVASDGAVWLTASMDYPDSGEIFRIDPATNQVSARLSLPGDPRDLVVGEGSLWVYSLTHFAGGGVSGGTIYRVDPETAQVSATLLPGEVPPASGINTPPVLALGHGFVWTSRHGGGRFDFGGTRVDIVRIDPQTNRVVGEPVRLDTLFLPFSTEAGSVWFRGGYEDARPTISRLDPLTLQIQDVLPLEDVVLDGAVDPGGQVMWLSNYKRSVTRIDLR